MASASGPQSTSVIDELFRRAYRFDFFAAVRLLERAARQQAGDGPARSQVGYDAHPADEIVRFQALPSLAFPSSSVVELVRGKELASGRIEPPILTCSFMGLTGPAGVLPDHFTSLLIRTIRERDHGLREWLDLFHHRSVSLFYRAWEKHRFTVGYERAYSRPAEQAGGGGGADRTDLFTFSLFSLVGLGTNPLRRRMAVDDHAILFYAGHFARYPRSATALRQIVADYFEMPAEVEQFKGRWQHLAREDCSSMGAEQGRNNQLGRTLIAGRRVWDVQSGFRIRLGPLNDGQFRSMLPSGGGLKQLCQLVRLYAGDEFDFDVQPVLAADAIRQCRLGSREGDGRLGWNIFMCSRPAEKDFDGVAFHLDDV